MANDPDTATIACSLQHDDLAERRRRWEALRSQAGGETIRTERGFELVFRAQPGVMEELEALAALERDCCAFADWTVLSSGDRLVLEVSGDSEQAIAAVHGMLR